MPMPSTGEWRAGSVVPTPEFGRHSLGLRKGTRSPDLRVAPWSRESHIFSTARSREAAGDGDRNRRAHAGASARSRDTLCHFLCHEGLSDGSLNAVRGPRKGL